MRFLQEPAPVPASARERRHIEAILHVIAPFAESKRRK